MATDISKTKAFEYVLFKLIEWYNESSESHSENDISTLKALKLLFFVSSVGTIKTSEDTLLDFPFNNFVAMPYGHVESDIYDAIKKGELNNIAIDTSTTIITNEEAVLEISSETKAKIDLAIDKLKKNNSNLIKLTSFDLVELSHRWFSWKKNYQKALQNQAFSHPILVTEIKSEDKFYQI